MKPNARTTALPFRLLNVNGLPSEPVRVKSPPKSVSLMAADLTAAMLDDAVDDAVGGVVAVADAGTAGAAVVCGLLQAAAAAQSRAVSVVLIEVMVFSIFVEVVGVALCFRLPEKRFNRFRAVLPSPCGAG